VPNDPPKAPTGLRAPGRRLWAEVVGPYILTPAELGVLTEACRTSDELDRLERELRALPTLTTTGSTGQLRGHPLLSEIRNHRALLERLMTGLNLPDDDQQVGTRATSRHARRAAQARWKRRNNGDPQTEADHTDTG
jgi:hypothetical protein